MKLLFDFFPILLFFIAYKIFDIYAATAVAMLAAIAQVVYQKIKFNTFEQIHLISLGLILILGSMTLFLHNPWFIKLKPTCIYWLFSLVFLFSSFTKKTIAQKLMENNISLGKNIWLRLNLAWTFFFLIMGIANLYVAFNFNTNIWVNFKLFGGAGLTLLFILIQSIYLSNHLAKNKSNSTQLHTNLGVNKTPKE